MSHFSVQQLDHIELYVPDRSTAADWYERILGLRRFGKAASWADNPRGPDHGMAFSAYFNDPWGTPLEVTTYDSVKVRSGLTG